MTALYDDLLDTIQQIGLDIKYINDRIDWIMDASNVVENLSNGSNAVTELSTVINEVEVLVHGNDTQTNSLAKIRKDMNSVRRKLNTKIILLEERFNLYILGEPINWTNLSD